MGQPEGDVLQGPGERGAAGSELLTHQARQDEPPTHARRSRTGPVPTAGLRCSPVQNHHHHGAVGAQESRVLQLRLLGLFGGHQPHALGTLRDELTAQA